ncbi:unnamed protein product [Ectocarpus sp. CCAP 1310/34]|nr:unnamed protein product [Ectocarpus sp. CCAP 1310/34]
MGMKLHKTGRPLPCAAQFDTDACICIPNSITYQIIFLALNAYQTGNTRVKWMEIHNQQGATHKTPN